MLLDPKRARNGSEGGDEAPENRMVECEMGFLTKDHQRLQEHPRYPRAFAVPAIHSDLVVTCLHHVSPICKQANLTASYCIHVGSCRDY